LPQCTSKKRDGKPPSLFCVYSEFPTLMPKPIIEIDGSRFKTLDDFWEEISACLIPGARWGRNFDAFNDILRGGFGTPEGGFRLKWLNFQISRRNLSYPETIGWLENKAQSCHQSNIYPLNGISKRHGGVKDKQLQKLSSTLFETMVPEEPRKKTALSLSSSSIDYERRILVPQSLVP